MTHFQVGDVVRPAYTTQRMVPTSKYVVVDVAEDSTAFGNFVTYYVRTQEDPNAPVLPVGNGHMVLTKVAGGN